MSSDRDPVSISANRAEPMRPALEAKEDSS